MMKIGKVINIKKTKNNVFILIKEKDDKIIQCVLRKNLLNSLENEIFLGDVMVYNCNTSCPNINKCKNYCLNLPNNIKDILKKIGIKCSYEICDGVLNIYGSLSDEQKSYIKHNLRLPVKSETRENTFSEKLMEDNYEYKNIL